MDAPTKIYEKWLTDNGLIHRYDDHGNIAFKYHGLNLFILNPGEDELYLQIILPNILEITNEEERQKALVAANLLSIQRKVIKANVFNDSVNLNVEMFVDTTPDVEDFMERVLDILEQGRMFFYKLLENPNS